VDRRDDPVTPLLTQWTYQAMVHELLGIRNNRIDLSKALDVRKDLSEVVLSCEQDNFFKGSMYLNYGDLGASIKDLVESYQRKTKSTVKLNTIEDMQNFVEKYPEYRQMSGNVSKHVALMTELSRIVDTRNLMEISALEQELACKQDHSAAVEQVLKVLEDPKYTFDDKLRVGLLYSLRYETDAGHQIATVRRVLQDKAKDDTDKTRALVLDEILTYAGARIRSGDLFQNSSWLTRVGRMLSSGIKGVENIFTQHKPLLHETLGKLVGGRLPSQHFPYIEGKDIKEKHDEVFVYIVGGVTYEEAACVQQFQNSKDNAGVRFILGGSCIHNSSSFIDDVLGYSAERHVSIQIEAKDSAAASAIRTGGGRGSESKRAASKTGAGRGAPKARKERN